MPPSVPSNKALKAIQLNKVEEFVLEMRDPLPLGAPVDLEEATKASSPGPRVTNQSCGDETLTLPPPSYDEAMNTDPRLSALQRSDSDLARELSARLNAE